MGNFVEQKPLIWEELLHARYILHKDTNPGLPISATKLYKVSYRSCILLYYILKCLKNWGSFSILITIFVKEILQKMHIFYCNNINFFYYFKSISVTKKMVFWAHLILMHFMFLYANIRFCKWVRIDFFKYLYYYFLQNELEMDTNFT